MQYGEEGHERGEGVGWLGCVVEDFMQSWICTFWLFVDLLEVLCAAKRSGGYCLLWRGLWCWTVAAAAV